MSPRVEIFGPLAVALAVGLGLAVAFAVFQRESAQREPIPTVAPAGVPTATTAPGAPVAPSKGNVAAGQAVFQTSCNACHPGGGQGVGPALQGQAFASKYPADEGLSKVIREGKGAMPAFGPERLNAQQLADVVAYMRSLGGTEAAPTKAPSPTSSPTFSPTAAPPSPTVTTAPPTAVPTEARLEPTATKAPPTPTKAPPTPTTPPAPTISGKAVFEAKCSTCHALPNPQEYSKWQAQFEPMAAMAGLSAAEKQAVLNYLQGR